MKTNTPKAMKITIGSTVRFIWKNVNWQGTVMDIRSGVLAVAVLGYENMFAVPQELCIPIAI